MDLAKVDWAKVIIPQADAYYGSQLTKKTKITKRRGAEALPDDANIEIDLYSVLEEIDFYKDKKFEKE